MIRRSALVAVSFLLFAASGLAQTTQQLPRLTIALQPGVPLEKAWIQYVLYGPFGAHGDFVREPVPRLLQIPTAVDGKYAGQIKIIVWAPGCRMATFDVPIKESSDVRESFSCSPMPTVTLAGRISPSIKLPKKDVEISVDYDADWACDFFGFMDCMVPQIPLGTTTPDLNGAFQIDVPDFSIDPVASDSKDGASLRLILREAKTMNTIAWLEPEPDPNSPNAHGLKISSFYPQNLVFVASQRN